MNRFAFVLFCFFLFLFLVFIYVAVHVHLCIPNAKLKSTVVSCFRRNCEKAN